MISLLVGLVVAGIALPHLLPLRRADATGSILLWSASLGLRALVGLFCGIWLALFLPATALFHALTHWCWHAVLPLIATHLGLDGHRVGDAAIVLPGLLLAGSVISVGCGVWRAARTVRALVGRSALGLGPGDTVIVGGPDVLVAAAGIGRPKVVVSAGALTRFDDEELAAALDHERGHIAHRHRFILLYAEACRAFGRFVPGTKRAMRELSFHLERDADRWALRSHDRFALASAILKAAEGTQALPAPAAASLTGSGQLEARLGALVENDVPSARSRRALRFIATLTIVLTAGLAASVPSTIAAGLELKAVPATHLCPG